MNEGHEDKGVGKEDCQNDEVTEDTKDNEKNKVTVAEARGSGE